VCFLSVASTLVSGDTNVRSDVFLRDRASNTTVRISTHTDGTQANNDSSNAVISSDARFITYSSTATNLITGDTNGVGDVFMWDQFATGFTLGCDPGVGGVMACPCANPPAGTGRGCDNSSSTGGAMLGASGIAYLSNDSLTFTTLDEKPTAASLLLQGDASIANGLVFGQGVRCAGGTLLRLFVKAASGGSITAPDLNTSDLSISARSASLGDTIPPGEPRLYLVYYRDPIVLGGCPAGSTFNSTQTGSVTWWP
jgi:hypothetical protein